MNILWVDKDGGEYHTKDYAPAKVYPAVQCCGDWLEVEPGETRKCPACLSEYQYSNGVLTMLAITTHGRVEIGLEDKEVFRRFGPTRFIQSWTFKTCEEAEKWFGIVGMNPGKSESELVEISKNKG